MKLAILNLTGGGISGGHKKYLQNILPFIAASPEIEAVLCASPASMAASEWLPELPKVSYSVCEPFRPFRHSPDKALRSVLDSFSPDVLFIPVERYINYRGLPVVVMLQNMAPLAGVRTGAGLKEVLVGVLRRYETRVALSRASAVIVPTEYVRNFVFDKIRVPVEKVTAIHYGKTAPSSNARPPAGFPFLGEEFILTAGSLESYRGVEDLLAALPGVKRTFPGARLAVAGGARPATAKYLSDLKRTAEALGISGDVVWLGNLPEEELSWCYTNCSAFVLTSRMESFCFVALEALTHGCRIISTDAACLPEILGDAAKYYRAGDVSALEQMLIKTLSLGNDTKSKMDAGPSKRSEAFIWQRAAEATINIFRNVFGDK